MTSSKEELLPGTARALLHRIAVGQSEGRAPSLAAAVARGGRMVWSDSRSCVDQHMPTPDTQYRIGSISKTFTAVMVMRLRDEGLLSLDDPLEKHLPGTGVGEVTIAQLLGHGAGLRAETPGPWWERTPGALRPDLPAVLGREPLVHGVGRRHHYSNPGYALLGALVAAVRGQAWEDVLHREILEPLSLDRTSARPVPPHAGGWAVHPWADVMLPEPLQDVGVMAPAGQLWSTTADLCRFGTFLLDGDDRVLSASSVAEMCKASVPSEETTAWSDGYGLGIQLARRGGRTLAGHTGSLPGFLACLWVCADEGLVAVALANATSGPAIGAITADLIGIVADAEPRIPAPWRPLPEFEGDLLELTGQWYWGTQVLALRLRADDGFELTPLTGPGRGARFTATRDALGERTWLGLDGYYAGETLRAVRRGDGTVSHLDLGSFVLTRKPYEPAEVVPGGVDEKGWR